MKKLLLALLLLLAQPAFAGEGIVPDGTLLGRAVGAGGGLSRFVPVATLFKGTQVGPITANGSSLYAATNGTTVSSLIGANVNFDAISGVAVQTNGSTMTNVTGVAGYCLNQNAQGGTGQSCVPIYGWGLSAANNTNTWGGNTIVTDGLGFTGQAILGFEIDTNVRVASTIGEGLLIQGASTAQSSVFPALSIGQYSIGSPGTLHWTHGLFAAASCCTKAFEFGASAASGTNINGPPGYFDYFDGAGAARSYTMQATSGSFNFGGTATTPAFDFFGNVLAAPGFGFSTSNGASGTGLTLGALAASGTNIASQPETFNLFDGASVARTYTIQGTSTALNFGGTATSPAFDFFGTVIAAPGFGFSTSNGAAGTGLTIGALATSGTNINSQVETFALFDGAAAAQTYTLQGTASSLNFGSTITSPDFLFGGNVTLSTGFGLLLGTDAAITDTSHVMAVASGGSINQLILGNTTASLKLQVANGGAAAKFVCVDTNNFIVLQVAACP